MFLRRWLTNSDCCPKQRNHGPVGSLMDQRYTQVRGDLRVSRWIAPLVFATNSVNDLDQLFPVLMDQTILSRAQ